MKFFRKIDRYVAGYFVSSYLVCFIFFLGIFIVIDLVAKMDEILSCAELVEERGQSLFFLTVQLYALKVPEVFLQVAPYLTLMASMFTVTRLNKANELIPMVMAGVSIFRALLPVFFLAFVLMAAMTMLQEFFAPVCSTTRLLMESFLIKQDEHLVLERQVLTSVDGKEIVVSNFNVNTRMIGSLDASYIEDRDGVQFNCRMSGENLRWLGPDKGWSAENGKIVKEPLNPGTITLEGEQRTVTTLFLGIEPDDIILYLKNPSDLSLGQIERLYSMNPTDLRLKILLHHHITFPLTNVLLLLLGLPFVLRHESRSNFLGIAVALAICLGYFALDMIMRDLGTQNYVPPILAAWFSVIFCGSLGICVFDSIRT